MTSWSVGRPELLELRLDDREAVRGRRRPCPHAVAISRTSSSPVRLSLDARNPASTSVSGGDSSVAMVVGSLRGAVPARPARPRRPASVSRRPSCVAALTAGFAGRGAGAVRTLEAVVDGERAERADLAVGAVAVRPDREVARPVVAGVVAVDAAGDRVHARRPRSRRRAFASVRGLVALGQRRGGEACRGLRAS